MTSTTYGEIRVNTTDAGSGRHSGAGPETPPQLSESTVTPLRPRQPVVRALPAASLVETLFQKYHRILMKYLRERLFDQDEVEDVAQEIYYRIARRPDLEELDYPKAFLMRTAKNLLIDMNRCRVKQQADVHLEPEEWDQEIDKSQDTPETRLMNEESFQQMESAFAGLNPKCQAVFVMNRIDGITFKQIAEELNLSQSMVEKYMRQALKCLSDSLEDNNSQQSQGQGQEENHGRH